MKEINPAAQVVFIDAGSDGIEQLADILSNVDILDALHIISHGEQGQLNLGTSALYEQTMSGEYSDELAVIGDALAEHGDILIYGCDFAGGEEGAEAAALLAELTGADIAASTDDTGAAVHGGDWDLESKTGLIEARVIQAVDFDGILADTDGHGVDDSVDLDKDGDGILDADESALPEFVNGDFSASGSGWASTGVNFANLIGGPNVGDNVARLSDNHVTASLSQTFPAETSVEEFTFDFGWNNGDTADNRTAGQLIEFQIDGVTYLTIETPDDGGNNTDDATEFGGDAIFTALNGATFSIANPSVQGSQFLDASQFNRWTLTPITVSYTHLTLPTICSV